MAFSSYSPSMNSVRTENVCRFHPGAHASSYYGDGMGRDFGIIRSNAQLHGTSDGACVATSRPVGLPVLPAPLELERGHPPGYTGHVPGRDDSYGETYAIRTARFNSPRDDGSRRQPPHLSKFSTSSAVIGAEREQFDDNPEEAVVPPLVLTNHKSSEELDADSMLSENPPRAIAPKSQRFNTRQGFTEAQLKLVRQLDTLAESNTEMLAQMGELVIINVPQAAQALGISEERLRGTSLSLPSARLIRENNAGGGLTGVAVAQAQWDSALDCAHS